MKFRWIGLLAVVALLTGCSASVPIRPYMFIQNEQTPIALPVDEAPVSSADQVS
ncbi:hypothetical protein [Cerasicoccus arenae]|uniref:hypothetical protein n=1 Tax=Cerasicoccus arenae TaxID=424488 RepID=UPI0016787E76|nr:hypothetical protein [Cerasicoccus arenae]MBK1858510.1 hypothetical protein [Cerasicoccus arenae]